MGKRVKWSSKKIVSSVFFREGEYLLAIRYSTTTHHQCHFSLYFFYTDISIPPVDNFISPGWVMPCHYIQNGMSFHCIAIPRRIAIIIMMTIIMPLFSLYIFFLLEIICFLKTNKSMGKGVEQTEREKIKSKMLLCQCQMLCNVLLE